MKNKTNSNCYLNTQERKMKPLVLSCLCVVSITLHQQFIEKYKKTKTNRVQYDLETFKSFDYSKTNV